MSFVRLGLLELWAVLVLSSVIAFLGPFGTYLMGDYLSRFWHWWGLMTGAYLTMRPIILLCRRVAHVTALPPSALVFWGMVLACFPLALLWRATSAEQTRLLGGYGGLLSFTLLCAGAVIAVTWWARKADRYLREYAEAPASRWPASSSEVGEIGIDGISPARADAGSRPRLFARLSPAFSGDIQALQSEDHYVRVHGAGHSELILMRLRDAILEMDDCPGCQTHRSWWVALEGIGEVSLSGQKPRVTLKSGVEVPVARSSIAQLKLSGLHAPQTQY